MMGQEECVATMGCEDTPVCRRVASLRDPIVTLASFNEYTVSWVSHLIRWIGLWLFISIHCSMSFFDLETCVHARFWPHFHIAILIFPSKKHCRFTPPSNTCFDISFCPWKRRVACSYFLAASRRGFVTLRHQTCNCKLLDIIVVFLRNFALDLACLGVWLDWRGWPYWHGWLVQVELTGLNDMTCLPWLNWLAGLTWFTLMTCPKWMTETGLTDLGELTDLDDLHHLTGMNDPANLIALTDLTDMLCRDWLVWFWWQHNPAGTSCFGFIFICRL